MVEAKSPKDRLLAVGIQEKTVENILKNKKVTDSFMNVLTVGDITEAPKEKGALLYAVATKLKPVQVPYTLHFVKMITEGKWTRTNQLDEGISFLSKALAKYGKEYEINQEEFETETGVGIVVTNEQIAEAVEKLFKDDEEAIMTKKHDYQFANLIYQMKEQYKWADGGAVRTAIESKKLALLGEEPANEGRKKKNKKTTEEKKEAKQKQVEDDEPTVDITQLIGRDVDIGNSAENLAKHNAFTQGKVFTRFPPEPNGYLHIGHAKAIRFNFTVAKEYGGHTYLRFDDTNPCKENNEFIDHIKEIVNWLGFTPYKTTASSDYFDILYEKAVELIKRDKAYVCFQNAEEMSRCRNAKENSPWRDAPIEDSLRHFDLMRQGRYPEGKCSLRMKMDMQHANPCMRDSVAYRIRFTGHPHSGDKWCIYPTYDYTHCMVDSLENITHSLCTLEFEIRRESYFQTLKDLDMYMPFVWEYSRLNLSNTVLSKRKIEALINANHVNGWDDPRLHTIQGLRRRGYTSSMINTFCEAIGVARKGNENITSYKKLEFYARKELDEHAPRTFAVTDPILLEIVNFEDVKETEIKAPLFPVQGVEKGTQTYTLTNSVYIDRQDFSEETQKGFFGLMPEQVICLRYGPFVQMEEIVKDAAGNIEKVRVRVLPDFDKKVKGVIQWVSKDRSLNVVLRQYNVLFTVEDVAGTASKEKKDWLSYVNPESIVVRNNAVVWDLHKDVKTFDRFQFERVGYYSVDEDSRTEKGDGKIVFNSIVALKEAAAKKGGK